MIELTLNCWVMGHKPFRNFQITVSSADTVGTLRDEIAQHGPVDNLPADNLILYDTNLLIDGQMGQALNTLADELGCRSPLQSTAELSTIFPSPSESPQLHIIVGELSATVSRTSISIMSLSLLLYF